MNRLLILLFGSVSTLAVAILLGSLYHYANEEMENVPPERKPMTAGHLSGGDDATKEGWLSRLATRKKPDFSYPVNEMEIELPLKTDHHPKRTVTLLLKHLDAYKLFCLKQLLEREKIHYTLVRKGEEGVVVVENFSKKRLARVEKEMRQYDLWFEKK
jgi:hypothetical protein